MRALRSALVASMLTGALATPALAQEQPLRHLVYAFTVGVQNDMHDTGARGNSYNDAGNITAVGTGDVSHLKEYDMIRKQMGPGQYSNIIIDITAQFATDSGVAART
jgi:hypothetical protein